MVVLAVYKKVPSSLSARTGEWHVGCWRGVERGGTGRVWRRVGTVDGAARGGVWGGLGGRSRGRRRAARQRDVGDAEPRCAGDGAAA
ncbi:hypothetical protein Afil01_04820 [Actinorhabdospora filicis]|uniref:Uncharacterized protein n=1 Tax=Actinorhabdospora filicis TaxID=1785913 RepID=A0A9W6SGN9_9ACTN|nr:hypothetical protein Afil01_04820 [Actinorhabdospora filicis]